MAKLDPIVEFREEHRKVQFSRWKLDELGKHFAQSCAEGVSLLRWADTIWKGQR